MFPSYIKKQQDVIFNSIKKYNQSGETSFNVENVFETYQEVKHNLQVYISGLLEGMILERGLANNLNDIAGGFNRSYKSKIAEDLLKPKKEPFRNIDLVEHNFNFLFAEAMMYHISGRKYIQRWQMYNQLFGVTEKEGE